MKNSLDKAISYFSPKSALKRAQARRVLSYYEAAKPGRLRKSRRETGKPNDSVVKSGASLREQARQLEENHDLARGILSILTANVIGPTGITIEPIPRNNAGILDQEFARHIEGLFADWMKKPEVTWTKDWASMQRIAARSWFRDGEMFARMHSMDSRGLDHGTDVPFSLELLEADKLPYDYNSDSNPHVISGIELNQWGRPSGYYFYKSNSGKRIYPMRSELRRVSASEVLHPMMVDRIGQVRGASIFASVLTRLEDLKDYEESERIAAKVGASMAGYIKKGSPDQYALVTDENGDPLARDMRFVPGMIFDDLMEGEEIGTIDTKRPNAQLLPYRQGQLRAIASGVNITYSSLAKDYGGSYSSQRQELVEGWGMYGVLASEFVNAFIRPVYERFIDTAMLAGMLVLPKDIQVDTLKSAMYMSPQMPWIDPQKEATSFEKLESLGVMSGPEIIRRRGQIPTNVMDQEISWRNAWRDNGETAPVDMVNAVPEEADTQENPQLSKNNP